MCAKCEPPYCSAKRLPMSWYSSISTCTLNVSSSSRQWEWWWSVKTHTKSPTTTRATLPQYLGDLTIERNVWRIRETHGVHLMAKHHLAHDILRRVGSIERVDTVGSQHSFLHTPKDAVIVLEASVL